MKEEIRDGKIISKSKVIELGWEKVYSNHYMKTVTYYNEDYTLGVTFYDDINTGTIFRIE